MCVRVCVSAAVSALEPQRWGLGAPGAERATDPRRRDRTRELLTLSHTCEVRRYLGSRCHHHSRPLHLALALALLPRMICGYSWAKAGPARPSFWGGHREVSDLSLRAGTLCESVR